MLHKVLPILLLLMVAAAGRVHAQELNCTVDIQVLNVAIERSILTNLQRDMANYLNTRRFTDHTYEPQERIKCNLTLVLNIATVQGRFEGTCQIQAMRPVYGTNYETVTFNFNDKTFIFNYDPSTVLNASENQYQNNLLSLLDYYGLMILGFDYDSFSLEGGIPYFQRAQQVLNVAQTSQDISWTNRDPNQRNRYWLAENMLNNSYSALHKVWHTYHRKGMDMLAQKGSEGRAAIAGCMTELQKLNQLNPNIVGIRTFIDAKRGELGQVLHGATPDQKKIVLEVLGILDPTNLDAYTQALQN